MRRIFGILAILLLIVSFFGTGFYLYEKAYQPEAVYDTTQPFYTDIVYKSVATGAIEPRVEIELKTQVSGIVETLYVEPGDVIGVGQLVAKIKIIPDVVRLNDAEMRLKTAVINFKNAERELERQEMLFEQKVISDMDYNQFLLQYQLGKQEVEAAENNLELVKEGASKKSGAVSNLVHSTAAGMVLDVPVKKGTFVIETNTFNDGTTIASVADMQDMIFRGSLDESEVGKVREGMILDLKIGALENSRITAVLEYISPKGVEEEGAIQFEIKAAVNLEQGDFLRAGYSANADIVLNRSDSAMAVEERNVLFDDDGAYVEVETAPQVFEKRAIRPGLSDGLSVEILEGLSPQDRIKVQ